MAKKSCHWRINTAETDYYGGRTKAQALKKKRKLGKGRLVKYCVKPGGKPYKQMSTLLQWGIIWGAVVAAIVLTR